MKKYLLPFLLAICTTVSLPILAKATDPGAGRTFLLIGQIYQEEYQNFINQVGLTPSGASIYGTFYTGSFEQGTGMSYVDFIENNRPGSRILAAM